MSVLSALVNLGLSNDVDGLLELANCALGNEPTGGASPSNINKAVDAINRGFDNCRFFVSCGQAPVAAPTTRTISALGLKTQAAGALLPQEFALLQNYPNPFNPSTSIRYALAEDSHVDLAVYNILGQRVATLVSEFQAAGLYTAIWDGTASNGRQLSTGMYFARMIAGQHSFTKKMLLLK